MNELAAACASRKPETKFWAGSAATSATLRVAPPSVPRWPVNELAAACASLKPDTKFCPGTAAVSATLRAAPPTLPR